MKDEYSHGKEIGEITTRLDQIEASVASMSKKLDRLSDVGRQMEQLGVRCERLEKGLIGLIVTGFAGLGALASPVVTADYRGFFEGVIKLFRTTTGK